LPYSFLFFHKSLLLVLPRLQPKSPHSNPTPLTTTLGLKSFHPHRNTPLLGFTPPQLPPHQSTTVLGFTTPQVHCRTSQGTPNLVFSPNHRTPIQHPAPQHSAPIQSNSEHSIPLHIIPRLLLRPRLSPPLHPLSLHHSASRQPRPRQNSASTQPVSKRLSASHHVNAPPNTSRLQPNSLIMNVYRPQPWERSCPIP